MRLPTFYEQNLIPNWGKLLLCSLFCYYACKYIALFYFHKTIYHFFLCFLKKSQKYTLFYYTTPQLHYI